MKSPLHIWLLYAACLAMAIPALGWLSWQAIELDRAREADRAQTELARQEAELQERISSALWRMDGMLTPLIAQEAARPYYLYESFYRIPSNSPKQTSDDDPSPSPLLVTKSEFVNLHFQLGPGNTITSPQHPVGSACEKAMECGLTPEIIMFNGGKLEEVRPVLDYDSLLEKCPSAKLPPVEALENPDDQREQTTQLEKPVPSQPLYVDPIIDNPQAMADSGPPASFGRDGNEAQQGSSAPNMLSAKQALQQDRNMSRGIEERNKRLQSIDQQAQSQWAVNNFKYGNDVMLTPSAMVNEGIMRPLWIDNQLILARRVESEDQILIQGCWLDWERIQTTLRQEVQDLLPDVKFHPIEDVAQIRLGQALATLPVQLEINRDKIFSSLKLDPASLPPLPRGGGIMTALVFAWSCLGFVAIAGAILLNGLIQLSERRGAFVSAVTHELRTPLTTFRMYAEMLAERMVPSPEKQQQYAQTMRVEADRLSHLVENVLQFARLERNNRRARQESTSWEHLLDRFLDRLQQRTDQCAMQLGIHIDEQDRIRKFSSDPVILEQILFNLVDNACKYARGSDDKRIELTVRFVEKRMHVSIGDYGPGISENDRRRMFLPFRKSDQLAADTAQGVGLGLALCRRMARALGGKLVATSPGPGLEMTLDVPT